MCLSSAPCADHQSRIARARSTPKKGVMTPETRMTRPTRRMARGAREAGAASISTPPNTTRIVAATNKPTGLANSRPIARSVLGEKAPTTPKADTAMLRATATRAMAGTALPNGPGASSCRPPVSVPGPTRRPPGGPTPNPGGRPAGEARRSTQRWPLSSKALSGRAGSSRRPRQSGAHRANRSTRG